MESPKYLNAKQIFDQYGIPRSALGQLAREGRISVRHIETEVAVMNLYSVDDLDRILNGSADHGE